MMSGRTWPISAAVAILLLSAPVVAQQPPPAEQVEFPRVATLEGMPLVRIDSTRDATTRTVLDPVEASENPLRVRVRDGRFYWASRDDRPLELVASGPYAYLSSGPGSYIRITRIHDKVQYVEHLDLKERGSVTWWGELRIVVGR